MISTEDEVRKLWSLLPHPTPEHVVRLFAKKGERKIGDSAKSPERVMTFLRGTEGMDRYVGVNPTTSTTGVRHKSEDVTHWSYLLLDADPLTGAENPHPGQFLTDAIRLLEDQVGKVLEEDVLVIDSGRGMQGWIRLNDVFLIDDEHRKYARKTMGYWLNLLSDKLGTQYECRLDTSVSDLPRVMRMPGTVNTKTGRTARIVNPSSRVFLGLDRLLVSGVPAEKFLEPDSLTVAPGTPWQKVYNLLTVKAQNYLMNGKLEPGRHETMWHVITSLHEKGISREQARLAVSRANLLNGKENALPEKQIETDLTQVYGLG